ncbi:MAG TPA: GNAT family N-acetyltransferase, partial [Anaerolineales bacterium]|nr:GNAT family N-acetyltransferase [Anaerolineales bacterium]
MDNNILPLPEGYTARGGSIEDYKLVVDLLNAHSQHLNGCDDLKDPELLRLDWLNDGFSPEADIRLVLSPDGSLVAFVECWLNQHPPVHPGISGCVHPTHWGKGIGSHLLSWAKDHARLALDKCEPDLRVAPRSGAEAHNKAGLALYEQLGWK